MLTMIHGRQVMYVNGKYIAVPKVPLGNGKVDRIASFARTPSNYGDMKIPNAKLIQTRRVSHK